MLIVTLEDFFWTPVSIIFTKTYNSNTSLLLQQEMHLRLTLFVKKFLLITISNNEFPMNQLLFYCKVLWHPRGPFHHYSLQQTFRLFSLLKAFSSQSHILCTVSWTVIYQKKFNLFCINLWYKLSLLHHQEPNRYW